MDMPGRVVNRAGELLAVKQRKDPNTPTSYRQLGEILEMNPNTVGDWINNKVVRYDSEKLVAWCDFFDCSVGDLLVYERDAG